jgi:transcriptional regulator with XRE-family HTH domain
MAYDRSGILVQNVVEILCEIRKEKGISMNKLAWMSGVSAKGIAFIERGTNSPTLRNICRIADALGVDLPQLFAKAEKRVN